MIREGILTPEDRVELLDGLIVKKMPINPPHRIGTRLLFRALDSVVPSGWYVDTQAPITLSKSEPEPDVAVFRGDTTDYADRHPNVLETALVAEVSHSSLLHDRTVKKRIYAQAGVPVYWLLDLSGRVIHVFSEPRDNTYRESRAYRSGEAIPVILDGVEVGSVAVDSILPPE